MSEKQGNGWTILLIVCLVVLGTLFAYDSLQAPADEIKVVVTMADGNQDASRVVKEFLAQHPVPTNAELRSLKEAINEQVALDVSRKATGNPSLQSPTDQSRADADTRAQYYKQEHARIMAKSLAEMDVSEKAAFLLYKLEDNFQWVLIPALVIGFGIGSVRWHSQRD